MVKGIDICQSRRGLGSQNYNRFFGEENTPSRSGSQFLGPIVMSAMSHKQTLADVHMMSALPLKADMDRHGHDVRFVPKAHINRGLSIKFAVLCLNPIAPIPLR